DSNIVVDDELEPGQTHAMVGNLGEIQGQLWVTHVHHDLQADIGHFTPANLFDFGFDQAIINATFVTFRAGDSDFPAVFEDIGSIGAADNCGDAELARDNGCVAGAAATIRDDARCQLHDRYPVGVSQVG